MRVSGSAPPQHTTVSGDCRRCRRDRWPCGASRRGSGNGRPIRVNPRQSAAEGSVPFVVRAQSRRDGERTFGRGSTRISTDREKVGRRRRRVGARWRGRLIQATASGPQISQISADADAKASADLAGQGVRAGGNGVQIRANRRQSVGKGSAPPVVRGGFGATARSARARSPAEGVNRTDLVNSVTALGLAVCVTGRREDCR